MGAIVKTALRVAIPLLLLQAVYGYPDYYGNYDSREAREQLTTPQEATKPLSWDELQVTSLQEINVVAQKIPKAMEEGKENCPYLIAMQNIKPVRNLLAAENYYNEAFESNIAEILKSKVVKTKELLCGVAERFRKQLKAVIALAKVVANTPRPQFLELVKKDHSLPTDGGFELAVKGLAGNFVNTQLQLNAQAAARGANISRFSGKPNGTKLIMLKRLQAGHLQFGKEVKTIMEAANAVLNSLHEAFLALKDIQQELRMTHGYPQNVAQLEAKLERALAFNRALGCSKIKPTWDQSTSFIVDEDFDEPEFGSPGHEKEQPSTPEPNHPEYPDEHTNVATSRVYPTVSQGQTPSPSGSQNQNPETSSPSMSRAQTPIRYEFVRVPVNPQEKRSVQTPKRGVFVSSLPILPGAGAHTGRWRSPSRGYGN
ncbi:unnamed protein product [Bemisia tabaci]|uniref:Uncharacterized protein n=1 Tax=Bemisia tabaci TaxID=7038 RepID=A0A9P0C965_BEMTA|nr:unnamed protein product [Bemisia tabaci]